MSSPDPQPSPSGPPAGVEDVDPNLIAVVGMAGRFPGAPDAETFWSNLRDGVESVRSFTDEELLAAGVDPAVLADPSYVKAGAPLDDYADFDAEFFGFGPKDAAIMDPQHRVLLEVAWEALESSGHVPSRFDGDIGVFAGSGMTGYFMHNLLTNPELVEQVGMFLLRHTGNDKDFLATRISYCLDLTGPSINVQTACSTSLVAIHQAAQSLLSGECDMALAGACTIEFPQGHGYQYVDGEILSPDGHCRAFDHRSQGTVFGSGAGMVVLRRLGDALDDGDIVHAVIRGSAVNNDGAGKIGYLAPSVDGQAAAVSEALAIAGVAPESIQYVEAHGTGTPVGDPIEIAALNEAFGPGAGPNSVAIGSAKTNIGHLDTAAGIAGFIKVVQALRHRQLPPSLNYEAPNRTIDFAAGPFYVNDELRAWPRAAEPRRAGISSLGVGGTNAHVVVEEAAFDRPTGPSRRAQLLLVSGRSTEAVEANTARLAEHLRSADDDLADIAYTLHQGREAFAVRRSVVATSTNEAIERLSSGDSTLLPTRRTLDDRATVSFLFPGGGAQYPDMGRGLYDQEPVYREHIDRGVELLEQRHGIDLRPLLFCDRDEREAAEDEFQRPSLQLPAIFLVEYALAQLWMSWGITPTALAGHSMGENTAACVAGVFSFEDALGLVALRGRLFEQVPSGGMVSVGASASEVAELLTDDVVIASVNAPTLTVVSGPRAALETFSRAMAEREIECRPVAIDIAAHSPMLDPILDEFRAYLSGIELHAPTLPIASNLTGTWLTAAEATDPDYWVRHLRGTVHFDDDVALLLKDANAVLLECGPGRTLSSIARQNDAMRPGQPALASLRHPDQLVDDDLYLLDVLGRLWAAGVEFDAESFYRGQQRKRVLVPTYAFQRQTYFIAPGRSAPGASTESTALKRNNTIDDWFYRVGWLEEPTPQAEHAEPERWLVFVDTTGIGRELVARLRAAGQTVVVVSQGDSFYREGPEDFVLAPEEGASGYHRLVSALVAGGLAPDRVVHLWSLTVNREVRPGSSWFHHVQERGFSSLLYLAQSIGENIDNPQQRWLVATNGMLPVAGTAVEFPSKATLLGPASVVPREFPGIEVTTVDVDLPLDLADVDLKQRLGRLAGDLSDRWTGRNASDGTTTVVDMLERDLAADLPGEVIGYRNAKRFRRIFERTSVGASSRGPALVEGGTYLITGGLGGIGATLADHLAKTWRAKVVLVSRTGLPPTQEWPTWLERHGPEDRTSRRIRRLQAMEATGAEVMVVTADVADMNQMERAVRDASARFGAINGVIHAAGVLDQDLIALKTDDDVDRVLTPKIQGALVLDRLFARRKLDFMVLMSSTSTVLGATGQVDYVAANAFLDAFAERRHRNGQPTYSLAWAAWAEVGMAAESAAESDHERSFTPSGHPLIDFMSNDDDRPVAMLELDAEAAWVLDEHRAEAGRAVLPGTAYLELLAGVAREMRFESAVQLEHVAFVSPLTVTDGTVRDVRVVLDEVGPSAFDAVVESATHGSTGAWKPHAEARLRALPLDVVGPGAVDLDAVRARCPRVEAEPGDDGIRTAQEAHLSFGPRWKVLREVAWGDGEAIARLSLPEPYRGEVDDWWLHPALLDLATGFGLPLDEHYADEDRPQLYVPLSYERLTVHAPLTPEVHSHIRCRPGNSESIVRFDITICDDTGQVLIDIENFAVVRIAEGAVFGETEGQPVSIDRFDHLSPAEAAFRQMLEAGIRPDEGWQAFERVLSGSAGAHTFVSPLRLEDIVALVQASSESGAEPGARFERPSLASTYAEPTNEVETALVDIWQDLLGVDPVGIDDDFFELGGHSLIAVRMFTAIKKRFAVDYPISVLFDAPTISAIAGRIVTDRGELTEVDDPDRASAVMPTLQHLVQMSSPKNATGRPFFLVAGMFGNVLNLRHLALLLGRDRALFGIQARGLRDDEEPHQRFEDMAEAYLAEIRLVQPEGPYLLGGFSGGGITAYEMARQLHAEGEEVAMVVMLDTPTNEREVVDRAENVRLHAGRLRRTGIGYLGQWARRRIQWERDRRQPDAAAALAPHEFRSAAIERAFYAALEAYEMAPYEGDVFLYRPGLNNVYPVGNGRFATDYGEIRYADNGWGRWVRGRLKVTEVPGDHDGMVLEPSVRVLASEVLADLAAVEAELDAD